jgi:hypothetical protein
LLLSNVCIGRKKRLLALTFPELAALFNVPRNLQVYGLLIEDVGVSDERRTFWFFKCSYRHEAHISAKALVDNIKGKSAH